MPNQTIDIHIQLDVSSPPEPTGPMDYVTLAFLAVVTLLDIILCFYIYLRGKTYAPLRSNLNYLLYVMVTCGLVNTWGSFVAAKQLDVLEPIRTASCVLWHFWIEYFIGMNGVFLTLMLRVLLRAYRYHSTIKLYSIQSKKILRNWILLAIIAPLFAVCLYATIANASYYDPSFKTCATIIYVKGLLMFWVFVAGLGIFVAGAVLENGIKGEKLSERTSIKRCIIVAAIVGISCAIINTTGLMRYSIGRSLFTLLLLAVHSFMFYSMIGYKAYKAIINDQDYAISFLSSAAVHDIVFKNLDEIKSSTHVFDDFLQACRNASPRHRLNDDAQAVISPQPFLICYEAIHRWRTYVNTHKDPINNDLSIKTNAIINTYIAESANPRICYDENIYNEILRRKGQFPEDLFVDLEAHILQELFDTWGPSYIAEWNHKSVLSNYSFNEDDVPLIELIDSKPQKKDGHTILIEDSKAKLAWLDHQYNKITNAIHQDREKHRPKPPDKIKKEAEKQKKEEEERENDEEAQTTPRVAKQQSAELDVLDHIE